MCCLSLDGGLYSSSADRSAAEQVVFTAVQSNKPAAEKATVQNRTLVVVLLTPKKWSLTAVVMFREYPVFPEQKRSVNAVTSDRTWFVQSSRVVRIGYHSLPL